MKKIFLMIAVSFLATMLMPEQIEAKQIKLNETVTSTDGCTWTIKAWIDVSILPPSINKWDVTNTDCKSNVTHFVGLAINPNNPIGNSILGDFDTNFEMIQIGIPGTMMSQNEMFGIIKSLSFNN